MAIQKNPKSALLRLLKLIRPLDRKYLVSLALRVSVTTFERLFIAYLIKVIIDSFNAADTARFDQTLIIWIIGYLLITVVSLPVLYLWRSTVFEVTALVRETVFKHLNRLPLGYHEVHHSGDALSILSNDVSAAEKSYEEDLRMLVEASAQGVTAVIYMMIINWQLALIITASGLAPLLVNTLFAGPLRKIGQQVQANLGGLSERMTDLLAGYQVVRTFNLAEWILNRFGQANDKVYGSSMKRVRTESALSSANEFAGMFNFISMIVGTYLVMNGQATFGELIALVQLSNQIYYFVYSIGGTVSRIQAALAAVDRILALLDQPAEPDTYPALPSEAKPRGLRFGPSRPASQDAPAIEFDQVLFGYGEGENILEDLSFQVRRGEMAAFAGPSGGGKSTIFKLLLGCYPVRQGKIMLSGSPVWDYRLSHLRELFAYVPQDAFLFTGTIEENIRWGKPGASQEEVTAAAKAAFAHDFISELPDGYQTMVGERGARLSGGQRQRIAIARALLKDAPILLLDEATSALDSESEQVVQRALEVLMQGRTTLVIAHRFSTILNADRIFVIEGGKVAEQGRHEQLMEMNGVYHNLFDLQFQLQNSAEAPQAA